MDWWEITEAKLTLTDFVVALGEFVSQQLLELQTATSHVFGYLMVVKSSISFILLWS